MKLLDVIKEYAPNYEESRYKMSIILDGFMAFLTAVRKRKNHSKIIPRGL